jgi:FtsH ternary system domain X1
MSATATAARVLSWASEPVGAPPTGPLWEAALLAKPPAAVCDAAVQLARRTAALMGTGSPPFSDGPRPASRIGLGVVFLAAAVGGRQQGGTAAQLAQAVPPDPARRAPEAWYDLVARHGLVSAAVTALGGTEPRSGDTDALRGEPLSELLLHASPLTAVLYRPPLRALKSDATAQAVSTAVALLGRPRGRAVLAAGLADWSPLAHVLTWRARLLARLRLDHPDLLLDVCLTARTRHGARWDDRIRWAARQLSSRGPVDPLALATLQFWAPLEAFERSAGPLSALRPLLTGHDQALKYVRAFQLDRAGAA